MSTETAGQSKGLYPIETLSRTDQIAAEAAQKVVALMGAYGLAQGAPGNDQADLAKAVGLAIYGAKVLASRVADITVATQAGRPALGIVPGPQALELMEEAAQTALGDPESASERLVRLAESETYLSQQKTAEAAIAQQGFSFWRENVRGGACPICLPFADTIHPASDQFTRHHPKCRCYPSPIK